MWQLRRMTGPAAAISAVLTAAACAGNTAAAPLRDVIAEALHGMAIPRPRLVTSAVADNPVLAGAIQAALAATREAVFSSTVSTNTVSSNTVSTNTVSSSTALTSAPAPASA